MEETNLQELFSRYLSGKASPEEVKLLLDHFKEEDETELSIHIHRLFKANGPLSEKEIQSDQPILDELYQNIRQQIKQKTPPAGIKPHKRHRLAIYAAAAMIAGLIMTAYFLFYVPKTRYTTPHKTAIQRKDIPPGGNKALLTLSNGTIITLDSTKSGVLSNQGNTKIINVKPGLLSYNNSVSGSREVFYSTITTPRGGQYQIVLPDGSKAWLNAASSVRFPSHFSSKGRKITVTGEVYLEVAQEADRPFSVKVNQTRIQVLGTHLNIRAYREDTTTEVTLLEGAIKVTEADKAMLLKPGEQARIGRSGELTKEKQVDTDGIMAWKNRQFWFDDDNIQTVMRELSRWYNVAVKIQGNIPQHFGGYISKETNVSKVFEALQTTGHLQYKIQNDTIIVSP